MHSGVFLMGHNNGKIERLGLIKWVKKLADYKGIIELLGIKNYIHW